jgi:hypothetical protein
VTALRVAFRSSKSQSQRVCTSEDHIARRALTEALFARVS